MSLFDKFRFSRTAPVTTAYSAFSTPLLDIGGGDLSLPQVNTNYTINNIVRFGEDNLYPQKLTTLYSTSGMHGACIDFIADAVLGGSYTWSKNDTSVTAGVHQIAFERAVKFKKLTTILTLDYLIHRRVTVVVTRKQKLVSFRRLDPTSIRNSVDGKSFVYSSDWARGAVHSKSYIAYNPAIECAESLYVYQDLTPGADVYPIPRYNSILNWAYLDGQHAFFHKANIQNSVFPSLVIRRPKDFASVAEVAQFKTEIAAKTGATNAGRILVLTGNGKDAVPEFQQITTNNNDQAFEGTAKELKDNICIAHRINPSIMGVKVGGSLGNSTEIKDSYLIFEKSVVMPLRNTLTEIFSALTGIAKIQNTILINNYQIVSGEIVDESALTAAQLTTLLDIATKVLAATLTPVVAEALIVAAYPKIDILLAKKIAGL